MRSVLVPPWVPRLANIHLDIDQTALDCGQEEQQRAHDSARRMAERSVEAQRASATVPRDTVQLYQQLARSGLQYGPAFRLLRNVHVPDTTSRPTTQRT